MWVIRDRYAPARNLSARWLIRVSIAVGVRPLCVLGFVDAFALTLQLGVPAPISKIRQGDRRTGCRVEMMPSPTQNRPRSAALIPV